MSPSLGTATWAELWGRRTQPLLAIPVGSCEQHGPHLPLDTDLRIATTLARGLVRAFDQGDILLGPALTITSSGEHAGFPGTLSIGASVMEQVIVELVRSADWAAGVVLVNGHGGNMVPVQRAVRTLLEERRKVLPWWPRVDGGDAHAGRTETSMMLAIEPSLVRPDRIEPGRSAPLEDLIDELRSGGMRAVSPNGILGDPTTADEVAGRALLTRLTIELVAAVDEWWV